MDRTIEFNVYGVWGAVFAAAVAGSLAADFFGDVAFEWTKRLWDFW